tara:strand:- start:1744 stop:2196 length:453 start_codon:yes stop_codon:yes gene_type:complete
MRIISHRGYIDGEDYTLENNPEQIRKMLEINFDVEIDVWYNDGFYLGHDEERYKVDLEFLHQDGLWCHAKNIEALENMLNEDIHCFWHQEDAYTITSKGFIWSYPNSISVDPRKSICLLPEKTKQNFDNYYGICTDYPSLYMRKFNDKIY